MWNLVSIILPQTEVAKNRAVLNGANWLEHNETTQELETYKTKTKTKSRKVSV